MFRPLLAAALSLALGLPAITAPAVADQRDYTHRHGANGPLHLATPRNSDNTGAVVGTLAIGALIAAALAKREAERRAAEQARAREADRGHRHDRDFGRDRDRGRDRGHGQRRAPIKAIPAHCLRSGDGPRGPWRGYGARCLERSVAQPRLLPRECLTRVRTYRGSREVYRGRCLSRDGWTVREARHR